MFYVLCGVVAAIGQGLIAPEPMVGASGAIAGVLGGYALLYPRARVKCLFIFIIFITTIRVPAWLLLGLLAGLVAAAPAQARRHVHRPSCPTAAHSWLAGSVWLCRGVLTYGDYADDDYGADTGQIDTTSRTASLMPPCRPT